MARCCAPAFYCTASQRPVLPLTASSCVTMSERAISDQVMSEIQHQKSAIRNQQSAINSDRSASYRIRTRQITLLNKAKAKTNKVHNQNNNKNNNTITINNSNSNHINKSSNNSSNDSIVTLPPCRTRGSTSRCPPGAPVHESYIYIYIYIYV